MTEQLWDRSLRTRVAREFGSVDPSAVSSAEMDAATVLARTHRDRLIGRGTVVAGRAMRPWDELDLHGKAQTVAEALRWYRDAVAAGLIRKRVRVAVQDSP